MNRLYMRRWAGPGEAWIPAPVIFAPRYEEVLVLGGRKWQGCRNQLSLQAQAPYLIYAP